MKNQLNKRYKNFLGLVVLALMMGTNACNDLEEHVYSSTTTANYYQTTDQVLAAYSQPYSFLQFMMYDMHCSLVTFGND